MTDNATTNVFGRAAVAAHNDRQLALSVGTDLPKIRAIKPRLPGFVIGSCHLAFFSPDGQWLVTKGSNGCALWDVASGKRIGPIKGVTNPWDFAFNADGTELYMRNESSQFARISIPDRALVGRFKPRFDQRLDGGV